MTLAIALCISRTALASRTALERLAPLCAVFAVPFLIGVNQAAAGSATVAEAGPIVAQTSSSSSASASASSSASVTSGGDGCTARSTATAEAQAGDEHSYDHDEKQATSDEDCSASASSSARATTPSQEDDGGTAD